MDDFLVSCSAFCQSDQPIIDYLCETVWKKDQRNYNLNSMLRPREKIAFKKELKGLKIYTTHQLPIKRKYPVVGVADVCPANHR